MFEIQDLRYYSGGRGPNIQVRSQVITNVPAIILQVAILSLRIEQRCRQYLKTICHGYPRAAPTDLHAFMGMEIFEPTDLWKAASG